MRSVLLVEDDKSLGTTLKERLSAEGYKITWARSLAEARNEIAKSVTDLCILDIGLPDGSGLEFASEVKRLKRTPILFLTADNSVESRLAGFELGADDYIPKPFHLKELLLRAARILEKGKTFAQLQSGEITMDIESLTVILPGGRTESPIPRDFELLRYLIETSPRVISREEVIREILKADKDITPRTVDNSVMRLRAHLGEFGERYIRSVRGIGYQWKID